MYCDSDVNEVIQKVVSQDQQQANLKQLTKENQLQIEQLNKEIAALKDRVDSVKYSGPGAKTVRVGGCWLFPLQKPSLLPWPSSDIAAGAAPTARTVAAAFAVVQFEVYVLCARAMGVVR